MAEDGKRGLERRDFLLGGVGTVGLLGVGGVPALAESSEPHVQRYVPLGRTGMEIADISFGSSRMKDPDVVRHAFDRGVNYFDSAESYKGGASEKARAALTGSTPSSISSINITFMTAPATRRR